jgi:hypothetical protein
MQAFSTYLHVSFSSEWVFWVAFVFGFALVVTEGKKGANPIHQAPKLVNHTATKVPASFSILLVSAI